MLEKFKWLVETTYFAMVRPKMSRKTSNVSDEYSEGWSSYAQYLGKCTTMDEWMEIKGLEDQPGFCNLSGELAYQHFDSRDFNRRLLLETIQREFPNARSITEYGCGVGRNLLYLKKHLPHLECYGYELCQPGVEIAQVAAKKWELDVGYSQLDYVKDEEAKYIFPVTDIAFTMYSLEQLEDTNKQAMENILRHTNYGSIHIEPVPENYPLTLRGIVGRLDHWKASYLANFERNISSLEKVSIERKRLDTAHSPLMFPTLYVVKKV
ncbi:MAG: class I SAM-dependent methyltransferase [Gallionellaceae bacterium]|jgi:hypothetical protein